MGSGSLKQQTRAVIERTLRDGWVNTGGTEAELAWQNVNFDPPDPEGGSGVWLEVHLLWGEGSWQTMQYRTETVGLLQVDIYTPEGTGLGRLHEAADVLGNVFTGLAVPVGAGLQLRFDVASGPVPMESRHAAWGRGVVSCAFTLEEQRSL